MHVLYKETFKNRLWESIAELEDRSRAEVVVIVRDQSSSYAERPLFAAGVASLLVLAFMLFSPWPFGTYSIFLATALSGFGIWLLLARIALLRRWVLNSARMERAVEIMGRALFQKGGIHHTREKTGLLIYISLFERCVLLLPDRGIEDTVPADEWEELCAGFRDILYAAQADEALFIQITRLSEILAHRLPGRDDDLNELPDELEVEL
jgi:putative membrane protein